MTEFRGMSDKVWLERARQDEKWGEQNHSAAAWMCILMEEVGELAEALLLSNEEAYPRPFGHHLQYTVILGRLARNCLENATKEDLSKCGPLGAIENEQVMDELVQVAAVAHAMGECYFRQLPSYQPSRKEES